jgi:hypothetical protein
MRKAQLFFGSILVLVMAPLLLFGQAACYPQKHAKLPFVLDLSYHKARPKLLRAGWQPYQTIHHNDANKNPNTSFGNGEIFWKKGYWEVESCAGTGLAACAFLFEDAYGNRLRLITLGEELTKPKSYARVSSYKFVCD